MASIPHVDRYSVQIIDGVATLNTRSGDTVLGHALSVRTLTDLGETVKLALARYAAGEQHVIEN